MPVPQAVLGLAFAWGALMGWVALFGRLDAPAYWLYAGAIAWVIGYDTIYAVQDIEDDEIAGIKSSARFFGTRVPARGGGLLPGLRPVHRPRPVGAAGPGRSVLPVSRCLPATSPGRSGGSIRATGAEALRLFRSNRDAGLILFIGLTLDALWQGLM